MDDIGAMNVNMHIVLRKSRFGVCYLSHSIVIIEITDCFSVCLYLV